MCMLSYYWFKDTWASIQTYLVCELWPWIPMGYRARHRHNTALSVKMCGHVWIEDGLCSSSHHKSLPLHCLFFGALPTPTKKKTLRTHDSKQAYQIILSQVCNLVITLASAIQKVNRLFATMPHNTSFKMDTLLRSCFSDSNSGTSYMQSHVLYQREVRPSRRRTNLLPSLCSTGSYKGLWSTFVQNCKVFLQLAVK